MPKEHADAIPDEIEEPRLRFADGAIQLGCRVKRGAFSGVLSLQVRPRISRPNEIEFEIDRASAGLIPVPLRQLVEDAIDNYRSDAWTLAWSTSDSGNDIVTLTLKPDDPAMKIDSLEVRDGRVALAGHGGASSNVHIAQNFRAPKVHVR